MSRRELGREVGRGENTVLDKDNSGVKKSRKTRNRLLSSGAEMKV